MTMMKRMGSKRASVPLEATINNGGKGVTTPNGLGRLAPPVHGFRPEERDLLLLLLLLFSAVRSFWFWG